MVVRDPNGVRQWQVEQDEQCDDGNEEPGDVHRRLQAGAVRVALAPTSARTILIMRAATTAMRSSDACSMTAGSPVRRRRGPPT